MICIQMHVYNPIYGLPTMTSVGHQMFETQYLGFKRMSRLPLSLDSNTIKYTGEEKGSSTNVLQTILLNPG